MQNNYIFRLIIVGLILTVFPAQQVTSIGAYPYPIEVSQPDSTVLTIHNHGDEWYNWTTTNDGYRIIKSAEGTFEYATQLKSGKITSSGIQASDPGKRTSAEKDFLSKTSKNIGISGEDIQKKRNQRYQPLLKSSLMSTHFPSEGEADLLVILANFNDTESTYSTGDFDAFMNEAEYNGTGSFKDYYEEVSGGKLTVNSTVTQWVQVPENHDYYGPEDKWGEFALQAVQAAADAGVDFSRFDNDGDGLVEGVAIIHQGAGEEVTADANDIWSHSYAFSSWGVDKSERTFNGVVVNQYTVQPEWRTNAAEMNTIGVISHEFGHNLGLIDFYDVDEEYYEGTGNWDIMASGAYNGSPSGSTPAHHNPFSKNELDWVDVNTIDQAGTIELDPVYNTGQVLRVNSPVDNEYLLLENRQKTGFDSALHGPGMLVYHVDGNLIEERRSTNNINTEEHQGFYPIAADGFINHASCPFPGSADITKLTDNSDPAMETWDGQPFNRSITSIEMVNETISFDFMYIQDGSPLDFQASTEDEQSIELSWTPAEEDYEVLLAWSSDGVFGTPVDKEIYNPGDHIDGGGTVLYYGINDTTHIHNSLEPSTDYHYSVWSNKGDMYSRNLKKHTQTRPAPVSTFPWTDGFENGLSNWYEASVSGSNSWTEEGPGFNDYPAEAYSGDSFASLYASNWNGPVTRLISPVFELQDTETYYLSFRHIQAEWEGDQDELKVLIRTQSSGTWEKIAHYKKNITEWGEHRLKLPVSEPLEIAFEGAANYGYGIGLDDVELRVASGCADTPSESATNISASNITKTSMDISWTRGNGDKVLIVARQDTSIFELPDHGVDYTANPEFGTGDQIADGTYVVYNGSGENVSLTGLQHTSDYHLAFFEYYEGNYCYENEGQTVRFSTEDQIYDIPVAVSDPDGNPLTDALVAFEGESYYTDTNGEVTLQVTHSNLYHRIDVSLDEFTAKSHRFIPDQQKTIETALRPFTPLDPAELTGTSNYRTVNLEWQPVIQENFDQYQAFTTDIPGWTFIDKDEEPTWGIQDLTWPNEQDPMAFMVFGVYEEEVLQMEYNISSCSGDKVLAAFAAQDVQSDDWVISPEFKVKNGDYFSFNAQTLDQGDWGKEVINVKIKPAGEAEWTTLQQNMSVPESWELYSFDLSDYSGQEVQVAIQSVGENTFILLLDDIQIGPEPAPASQEPFPVATTKNTDKSPRDKSRHVKKPQRILSQIRENNAPTLYAGNVEYNIYRNNEKISTVYGFANTSFLDEVPECADFEYTVTASFPYVNMESDATSAVQITSCYFILFIVETESGNPIEDAEVTFNNETLFTNTDGEVEFAGVNKGTDLPYTIEVENFEDIADSTDIAENATIHVVVQDLNSISDESWSDKVLFTPNPVNTNGTLHKIPNGLWEIVIYDATGQKIATRYIKGGRAIHWDFSKYKPGIYFMIVQSREGRSIQLKIIKTGHSY